MRVLVRMMAFRVWPAWVIFHTVQWTYSSQLPIFYVRSFCKRGSWHLNPAITRIPHVRKQQEAKKMVWQPTHSRCFYWYTLNNKWEMDPLSTVSHTFAEPEDPSKKKAKNQVSPDPGSQWAHHWGSNVKLNRNTDTGRFLKFLGHQLGSLYHPGPTTNETAVHLQYRQGC